MARSQRRWINDDAAWAEAAYRQVAEQYDVAAGWAVQGAFQDRDAPWGDADRRQERAETALPRVDDRFRAGRYDHPAVDALYSTVARQDDAVEGREGTAHELYQDIDRRLAAFPAFEAVSQDTVLAELPDAIVIDEGMLGGMLGKQTQDLSGYVDAASASEAYQEAMDATIDDAEVLRGDRDSFPWTAGFTLLDQAAACNANGADIDVYYPSRTLRHLTLWTSYGMGGAAELQEQLQAVADPFPVDTDLQYIADDRAQSKDEDARIAEFAHEHNAVVLTHDNDFRYLEQRGAVEFTPVTPDVALAALWHARQTLD